MAKKKTIDLRSVDPTPVPAGDVNIIYNGTRIGGFSEDTEAVLKTAGCRVEHDINVNYTKPETSFGCAVTISNSTNVAATASQSYALRYNSGNITFGTGFNDDGLATGDIIIPMVDLRSGTYIYSIVIEAAIDNLNVTINNTVVAYASSRYEYEYADAAYPETVNIVITPKD